MTPSKQSSKKKSTIWTLEPHTEAKHALLRGYLSAWFPILAKYNKRLLFLGAFAGPGVYSGGEPGSPVLALRSLLDHTYFPNMSTTEFVFLFNEQEPERFAALEFAIERERVNRGGWPSNVTVHVEPKNFTELAADILELVGDKALVPTFAFIDPFGYRDVPMELIARLLSFPRSELFIYFDFNSVQRFSTAGVVDEHFQALFGTDKFKQAPPSGDRARQPFLHNLYKTQLVEVCKFPYVQSFEMVNIAGKTGNYLFFCTRDILGFDLMKGVMWQLAPLGNFRFTDVLAGHDVLFMEDVDTEPLRQALLKQFAGQTVSIETIENYVSGSTPYVRSHIRVRTLKPMQKNGQIICPGQRRMGQFPSGTLITFLK